MEDKNFINKPSLVRLSKIAGVKSLSQDSYDILNKVALDKLEDIVDACIIVNSQNKKKIISKKDLYSALHILGYNLTSNTD
jgi:histone H3/H4